MLTCYLCGCVWPERSEDRCSLGEETVCKSCHDNFYGTFNKADFDANELINGELDNRKEIKDWLLEHCAYRSHKVVCLTAEVNWPDFRRVNVLMVNTETHEFITLRYKEKAIWLGNAWCNN